MSKEANEKVMAKIRKLLARADANKNDNEHERAIAMRQAHALLTKHGIDIDDVGEASTVEVNYGALGELAVAVNGTRPDKWMLSIYHSMAVMNGCYSFVRGKDRKIVMVGRALRVTVARQMGDYVMASILSECKRVHQARYSHIHGRVFSVDFGDGAAAGVRAQVEEIIKNMKKGELDGEKLSDSHALVVVNQHALALKEGKELAYNKYNIGRGTSRVSRMSDAYSHGVDHGRSIQLNAQVGGATQRKLGS